MGKSIIVRYTGGGGNEPQGREGKSSKSFFSKIKFFESDNRNPELVYVSGRCQEYTDFHINKSNISVETPTTLTFRNIGQVFPTYKMPHRAAFTLAELLITLGIIGVVAALTIPQLIKNVKHHVLENQFKQASSVLQQVVLLAREELGVDNLKKFCTSYEGILGENISYINSTQCIQALNYAFTKDSSMYVNSVGEHSVERDPNSMRTYNNKTVLQDYGGIAGPYALKVMRQNLNGLLLNFTVIELQVYINVDINGFDGPNQLGHDIFIFYLSDKDTLTGHKQTAVYTDEELAEMDFDEEYQRARAGYPCNKISGSSANGFGCTWFAINDIDPETNKKGYWKNLP